MGIPGEYSEIVASKVYPDCEPVPYKDIQTICEAIEGKLVNQAIIPIREIQQLSLLQGVHIVSEVQFQIGLCLLANHGVELSHLDSVDSTHHAIEQCESTLTNMGLYKLAMFNTTANAAQEVAKQKFVSRAAVASSRAADIYGLNILAHDIQDEPINIGRFLILSRDPVIPRTADKPIRTSIVMATEGESSCPLFKALDVFAKRNIKYTTTHVKFNTNNKSIFTQVMTHGFFNKKDVHMEKALIVDSVSLNGMLINVEFDASPEDQNAKNALTDLERFAEQYKKCLEEARIMEDVLFDSVQSKSSSLKRQRSVDLAE
ncbi:hypothetical protein QJS10_CPB21g00072 [Acorus calamus]|uniref:Prephenate dehydratase domain-containing protein n=1 Tax=Acorus calamus TaxID=4465 RepID=A0AAV9C670_ACOCL|nr:hypothetical protein QJS10_CPB21g00072 [Acorus calamus]